MKIHNLTERNMAVNVAFVGGGRGCYDILHMLHSYSLSHITPKILAVIDPAAEAIGRLYAEQLGIPTDEHYEALLDNDRLDLIIELTGDDRILADINSRKLETIKVMDHLGALFLWEIIAIQNDKLHLEQKVTELDTMAAVGEISYRLTHELRNPLMIVGGLVRRMMTRIDLPHGIRKRLKHISGHTQHMENVLSDICDIVRPLHPHYGQVNMGEFLENWCRAAQLEARITGTAFTYDIEDTMPDMYIDQSLIRQALWHIIENSFDAMTERGGEIFVKAEVCWDDIFIRITDKGGGLQQLSPNKARQPFISTKTGRMGLGLTLCQQILYDHHGTLELFEDHQGGVAAVLKIPININRPQHIDTAPACPIPHYQPEQSNND